MFSSPPKFALALVAFLALTFCCSFDVNAQGRGFRIGNVIQAGGGQGFRMGGPRFGMHFGGGQGASIGGQNIGMRFGNGQGARIGGANYGMQFGGGQGTQIGQFYTSPMVTPGTYYYGDVQFQGYAQPVIGPVNGTQPNYAAPVGAPTLASDLIRLSYPANQTQNFTYKLNGTEFTLEPGKSVFMARGQEWNLVFSAGEGLENRHAKLSGSGNFVFSKTADEGWVLLQDERTAQSETQFFNPNPTALQDETSTFTNPAETKRSVLINDVSPTESPKVEADARSGGEDK